MRLLPGRTNHSLKLKLTLGVLAGLASVIPACSVHAQAPDSLRLTAVVRDFHRTDGDFSNRPTSGNGHYAGNIAMTLDSNEMPKFVGGGFKVRQEWRDPVSRPIAPHLSSDPPGAIDIVPLLTVPIIVLSTVDSFNPAAGPYGAGNGGPPAPTFLLGATMPSVSLPTGMGPPTGDFLFTGGGTVTLDSNLHCNRFEIRNGTTLEVDGNIVVLADDDFVVEAGARIELLPCATLTVYLVKEMRIDNDSLVNVNTANPARLNIVSISPMDISIEDRSHVYANLVSPLAQLTVEDEAHFYGTFVGRTLSVTNDSGFHFGNPPRFICCDMVSDLPGDVGPSSSGGIVSADNFAKWFSDVPGTNFSTYHVLELVRNFDGIYEYLADEFHPVDGQVFGNEGQQHNYYFTTSVRASFVYQACAEQFIEFMGDDDAWMFIDGRLAMDLGGIIPGTEQYVEMDRLGLQDGQRYMVNFFHAQRQSSLAGFRLRTNIVLEGEDKVLTLSTPMD